MNTFAPIALFAYNRPKHTLQVLDMLAKNPEAIESNLYVFCDGPKNNENSLNIEKINQVKKIIQNENRFKNIIIEFQEKNKGLANSIISGVTKVVNKHNQIIVLEDNLVPSIGFLKYMNESLNLYENDLNVGCIHAWNYHFENIKYQESTFFLKGADCWGWSTWKRSWDLFCEDSNYLLDEIIKNKLEFEFDKKHPSIRENAKRPN